MSQMGIGLAVRRTSGEGTGICRTIAIPPFSVHESGTISWYHGMHTQMTEKARYTVHVLSCGKLDKNTERCREQEEPNAAQEDSEWCITAAAVCGN